MRYKQLKIPREFVFFVTDKCPLRCHHCFYWRSLTRDATELGFEQIKAICSSFKYPIDNIILTGGEPFLRDDLAEICHLFSKFNKTENIQILTNGYFPETIYSTVKKILETSKLNLVIQVSLDGLKETHNLIRNDKESYDRAVRTIRLLKEFEIKSGLEVRVATTICQKNFHELENLAIFVRRNLEVRRHIFDVIRDISCYGNVFKDCGEQEYGPKDKSILLSLEQLKLLKSRIKKILFHAPFCNIKDFPYRIYFSYILKISIDSIIKKRRRFPCSAGHSIGVIYAPGDVAFCEITKPIGNLKEANLDLNKIWDSEEAHKRRLQVKDCYCSHTCYLFAYFRNCLR